MFIIVLILGYLSFLVAGWLVTSDVSVPLVAYFDPISFMIVPLSPYLITTGVTKKFNFDESGLKLFGDLCIGCAIIAVVLGIIMMLYGWGGWESEIYYKNLGASLVITVIPLLYGLTGKYLIVLPMIAYKKNCLNKPTN